MKKRFFSLLIVLMLFTVMVFSGAFSTSVSAASVEGNEDYNLVPDGTPLWFQSKDEITGIGGYGYSYNYSAHSTYTYDDLYSAKDGIGLLVHARSVTNELGEQVIALTAYATGISETPFVESSWHSTAGMRIAAKLPDNAPQGSQIQVWEQETWRRNMADNLNDQGGGEEETSFLYDFGKLCFELALGEIPIAGAVYTTTQFFSKYTESELGFMDMTSAGAPGEIAYKHFRGRPYHGDWMGDTTIPEDLEPYQYQAGTRFYYKLPEGAELPDVFNIEISATNIMGLFMPSIYDDDFLGFADGGAEAKVVIPVKNGEPSIISEMTTDKTHYHTSDYGKGWVRPVFQDLMIDNVAGSTDPSYQVTIEYYAYWSTGGTGWEILTYDWISIYEEVNKAATIPVPEGQENRRVDIRYTIEAHSMYGGWVLGPYTRYDMFRITDDLDTVLSVEAPADASENSYGDHTYVFTVENAGDTDGSVSLAVDDTAGWPVSVEPSAFNLYSGQTQPVDVTVTIPDGVPDGEYSDITLTATAGPIGGGGCPHVFSWNGTDYHIHNNILIASEHQGGIVDDHYILQNNVEPKDGYYSLKIEEFENSKDHFDMVKLYTIDHQEGYEVATTPEGEYIAYREPRPALSAYDSDGEDVLGYLNTTGNGALSVDEDSWVILNFGEITKSQWEHNKLVVVSHGFESYTQPPSDIYPWLPPVKTSLHASMRMDGSEWVDITVLHPRNNPSAVVIPLNETLEEFFPGRKGNILGELEVKILSTDDHYIDFVGIDDTVPAEPTKVQEATLASALLNGETDVTDLLSTNDTEMVTLIPGEFISLDFDIPEQSPAPVFSERSYMLYSRGYYELFMGSNEVGNTIMSYSDELLSETVTASDKMTVTFNHPGSSVSVTRPQDMTVSDYGTYTVEFTVGNHGDLWDTYDLMVTETEGWTVTVVDSVTVEPGTSVPVGVEVNIPTTASDGTSTIELTAESRHGGQTDSANMNVNFVYQHPGSSVSVNAPSDAYESTTGTKTYTFTVSNTGDLADTYDLSLIRVSGKFWARSIDGDTSISLNAGETKNLYVKVNIPSFASHEDYMVIRLRATSQHGSQTNSDTMRVTFIEPPYVEITQPANGAIIYTPNEPISIVVRWEGEPGIDNYWIRLNGGSWINVGTSTSYTLENLYYGSYTVTVRARKDGIYGYDSVSFTVQEIEDIL